MKITKFETHEEWMAGRIGKITGSRLKDLIVKRGTGDKKKIGFYELIAERIGLPADGENPMERGHRLEEEAIERFEVVTKKEVDKSLVIWSCEDNPNIAVSPDGMIGETEAVEVKCLSSARHIEALLTNEVPKDFEDQVLQYFIVNDKLETLYLCFYDPRLKVKDFFYLTVNRVSVLDRVEVMKIYEKEVLEEVDLIVNSLMF
jgi:hypothetical protein